MKHLKKLIVLGFWGLGAACGDDDGGGGSANVDTGLPESQPLSEVTPAQLTSACNSIQSSVDARFTDDRITRFFCEFLGAAASDDAATCRDLADDCVNDPELQGMLEESGGLEAPTDVGCGDEMNFEGCSATVGELETCVNDTLAQVDQFLESFSCANAATIDLETDPSMGGPLDEPPASCTRLSTQCPGSGFGEDQPQ